MGDVKKKVKNKPMGQVKMGKPMVIIEEPSEGQRPDEIVKLENELEEKVRKDRESRIKKAIWDQPYTPLIKSGGSRWEF